MTALANGFDYGRDCHYRYRASMLEEEDIRPAEDAIGGGLRRVGVQPGDPTWRVMNIGVGGEALALRRLSYRRIDLFDLSAEQIARFCDYQYSKSIDGIVAAQADATTHDFGIERYDLVVARGVVQHTQDPPGVLAKLLDALRPGGYLHFFAYQSGAFRWFFVDLIRQLSTPEDMPVFLPLIDRLDLSPFRKIQLSDDLLTPNVYLKTLEAYRLYFRQNGFEVPAFTTNRSDGLTHVARVPLIAMIARKASKAIARARRLLGDSDDQADFRWSTVSDFTTLVLNFQLHRENLRAMEPDRKFALLAALHRIGVSLDLTFTSDDVAGRTGHAVAGYRHALELIRREIRAGARR